MNPVALIALILMLISIAYMAARMLLIQRATKDIINFLSGIPVIVADDDDRSIFEILEIDSKPFLTEPQAAPYLQNVCINNKDPSKMGPREQLLEFIKGPCQPAVLVPGLIASKLTVNIDCPTLQSQSPEIFSQCGWNSCKPDWNPLTHVPKASYSLWISEFSGPLSLLWDKSVNCWGDLIQLNRESTETDITKRYKSPPGVTISLYNTTSSDNDKCGFAAEQNLLDSPFQVAESRDYYYMKNALIAMGYQVGMSLYGAPYDWRKTTLANGVSTALKEIVQQAYTLTGKPTIVVAHSLGSFGTLHMLNSLTQGEKDKYVSNYITITNALNGSPKAAMSYLGADAEYYFWNRFGVNYFAQKKLLIGNSGTIDVLQKDPFTTFAGQQWVNDWHERVKMEADYNISTPEGKAAWEEVVKSGKYSYRWFPTPLTQCFTGFKYRPNNCALFGYDWSQDPVITVQGKDYTGSDKDTRALLGTYSLLTDTDGIMDDSKTNNIYKLENPGVPVTVIYASHLPTYKSFTFNYDPRDYTNKGQYAPINEIKYTQGDGTVPTASALISAFKWAWEFDNKDKAGLPNAKPVKVVELCSINNNKETIYDKAGGHENTFNEYIGVRCDCNPKEGKSTDGAACSHPVVVSDAQVIQFIQNIANANAPNPNFEETGAFKMTDDQLKQIVGQCPVAGSPKPKSADVNAKKERAELFEF